MSKVSIVLPSYNGSTYIKKSIESVIAQEYTDWELIIVDDCSTDDTLQIARAYAEKDVRIRVHHNETNQKLPESLNIGFRQATGDFLTWTSDDNWFATNAIGTFVSYLEAHADCGLVYSLYDIVDEEGQVIGQSDPLEPSLIRMYNVVGASFMYRREVAERAGEYDQNLFLAEDYEYWLALAEKTHLHAIPEKLYYYRTHGESLSQTKHRAVCDATARAWEKHWPYLVEQYSNLGEQEQRKFVERYYDFSFNHKEAYRRIQASGLPIVPKMRSFFIKRFFLKHFARKDAAILYY